MPIPTLTQIEELGPSVLPFERTNFSRTVLKGEQIYFGDKIYNATEDSLPENVIKELPEIIRQQPRHSHSKYLWIITENGLYIILENTPNPSASRKIVCHTNISGGLKALQGGELWFGTDDKVYINNRSGRYGATTLLQRNAIIDYFQFVGYKTVIQLLPT